MNTDDAISAAETLQTKTYSLKKSCEKIPAIMASFCISRDYGDERLYKSKNIKIVSAQYGITFKRIYIANGKTILLDSTYSGNWKQPTLDNVDPSIADFVPEIEAAINFMKEESQNQT